MSLYAINEDNERYLTQNEFDNIQPYLKDKDKYEIYQIIDWIGKYGYENVFNILTNNTNIYTFPYVNNIKSVIRTAEENLYFKGSAIRLEGYTCKKCKSNNMTMNEYKVASADESLKLKVICVDCGTTQ